jgi:hypothetical protein
MASSKRLREALDRLAAAEQRAFTSEFLAPVIRGGTVRLRIEGVVCQLKIATAGFQGWGVFRPNSPASAELIRTASLTERRRYLELLPMLRLVICERRQNEWLAIPANEADTRFRIERLVPVLLIEEAQLFDTVLSRFDGSRFWHDGPDLSRDPSIAAYLRESLSNMVEPEQLNRPGLSIEERKAYAINYAPRLQAEIDAHRDRVEARLWNALAHAGAVLKDYLERDQTFRVTYEVDGQRHVSVVNQNDLSVQVAGICLSGEDRHFDLESLAGVLREGQAGGHIVRVGFEDGGLPEGDYWDAHPPAT